MIPDKVRHGEELICSYFACRNTGVKFRYCSHCKVPVAKRNFRKRHKHGDGQGGKGDDESASDEDEGGSDEADSKNNASQGAVPSLVTTSRTSNREETIPTQVTTTKNDGSSAKKRGEDRKKKSSIPVQVSTSSDSGGISKKKVNGKPVNSLNLVCMRSGDERSEVVETRRQKWAALLEKRPQTKDGEAISTWLLQVLAVSDLWKPLNESEPTVPSSDSLRESTQTEGKVAASNAKKDATATCSTATVTCSTTDSATEIKDPEKEAPKDDAKAKKSGDENDSGSSDSPESNHKGNSSENQAGNNAKTSSNDSDNNQGTETNGKGMKGNYKESSNKKKNAVMLKKRPVFTVKQGDGKNEDSVEPPKKGQKFE